MGLKEEIANKRNEIIVDAYTMSIGEVINIYKDGELDVHPEFQRFFRWEKEQKTKLIESILLGIPIPPIFVFQKTNGKWDVIDGQQRLSTILQFLHILEKDDGEKYDPLILLPTKFLPSLEGVGWNNDLFSQDQKIIFKREKLNFTIIKETPDNDNSKYEMFQRLNTGGTHLSPQEIRNCLLIMINKDLHNEMLTLNENENFKKCFALTDTQSEERYDLELVVRYLLYISFSTDFLDKINKGRNMDIFLTEELEKLAERNDIHKLESYKEKFTKIFTLLYTQIGEDSFKRYKNNKFTGGTLLSSFEAIVPGLYNNIDYWETHSDLLQEKIKNIYCQEQYEKAMQRGTRALDRMSQLIKFSREWFSNEN